MLCLQIGWKNGCRPGNKLAIKPPGLMWKGKPAISTSQLLRERDKMMMRKRGSKDKEPVN